MHATANWAEKLRIFKNGDAQHYALLSWINAQYYAFKHVTKLEEQNANTLSSITVMHVKWKRLKAIVKRLTKIGLGDAQGNQDLQKIMRCDVVYSVQPTINAASW